MGPCNAWNGAWPLREWGFFHGDSWVTRKYDTTDQRLLSWLRDVSEEITTAHAVDALDIVDPTTQRHISRRFTLLEDRGALRCRLHGTMRICSVDPEKLPEHLHKSGPNNRTWRSRIDNEIAQCGAQPATDTPVPSPSIPASTSEEFLAAGGTIERLPANWDHPYSSCPLGPTTLLDHLNTLD